MTISIGARDLEEALAHGLSETDLQWQLELLNTPPPPLRLDRPCTVEDGVLRLDDAEQEECEARFAESAHRFSKFVPASGAASRMFKTIAEGHPEARRDLADHLSRFAFADMLKDRLGPGPAPEEVARVLLQELKLDGYPKGLLPFHQYSGGPRTAFEEHLREAAEILSPVKPAPVHFTVSPQHQAQFERELDRVVKLADLHDAFRVEFSNQATETDTVALDKDGSLFRSDKGLVFRPGGHGALLNNLQQTQGDLVLVKNIDNIVPQAQRTPSIRWKRILGGLLVRISEEAHSILHSLEQDASETAIQSGAAFCGRWFGAQSESSADAVQDRLNRPLRVCGVVINQGEPGGGPFWAESPEGVSQQIVERSQADVQDSTQRGILDAATHFNPVDLAVSLRDLRGRAFNLQEWVDPNTAFIAEKSAGGRTLVALERPGLWNGAMGKWNTVFVEVPVETFAPVKTIFDLLRPQHQPVS